MIEIKNLKKNYGETRAVKGINLKVNKGEILGLLGPNGAGKSSTLRILTGYLSPTGGTITVKGLDVRKKTLQVKEMIGYLPESAPLYSEMLVFDYLNYIADIRSLSKEEKKERILKLSGLCGINNVMHKTINSLSKGYKQRVGLAQAMMSDPEILVLDEPTTGLDPNQIVEIRNIIKEIGKTKTVIFSTHILSEAEATCDRVVIINNGQIAADGSADELKETLAGDIQLKITLNGAKKDEVLSLLKGREGIDKIKTELAGEDLLVTVFTKEDIRKDIYNVIKKQDWMLLEFTQEKKSLENIFRQLTGEENK